MFIDDCRNRLRARHYAYKTEISYLGWIRRYILWNQNGIRATWARLKSRRD